MDSRLNIIIYIYIYLIKLKKTIELLNRYLWITLRGILYTFKLIDEPKWGIN
jgi:hypothetical protein